MMTSKGQAIDAHPPQKRRGKLKKALIKGGVSLALLGAVVAYFALTPRSQPCWPKPEGYIPTSLLNPPPLRL